MVRKELARVLNARLIELERRERLQRRARPRLNVPR